MATSTNEDIYISRQTAARTQMVGTKEIYTVVKQCNFLIVLNSNLTALDTSDVECILLYDTIDNRPVPYVHCPPIKYKIQEMEEHILTVECKLTVLSSQHEDSLFKVKVILKKEGREIATLISCSIKCTSKLESKKKPKFDSLKSNNEKRIRPSKIVGSNSNSSTPTSESSITTQSLLNTNTILMDEIRKNLNKGYNFPSFEIGFTKFIQLSGLIERPFLRQYYIDSIRAMSGNLICGLDEITSVLGNTPHQSYSNPINPQIRFDIPQNQPLRQTQFCMAQDLPNTMNTPFMN
ncbi:hypothetical protein EIN_381040 [Entamoeba invadens IP1]|uniref:Uncharacterized protein n=1 Tax=Entamoeba invadens IP1 TaxID=370355 RepID=A0A0A1UAR0_ENTIV|nr:hypothetical protein EIN_381040 [Entamoeba invadens IP1]ELP92147.1 hypothetical protein EIN_381040 [Entamoeba invadens IP1]|eukprot:XP_004258918.1 hypothetical protein EIN_381040 [Entamoeba invadens IP1]